MKTVTQAFSYNSRWLARPLNCDVLKFGDDGIQATVILLEGLDHCGPIILVYWWKFLISNLYTNQWILNLRNWWYSQRLTDKEHNSETGLRLGYI